MSSDDDAMEDVYAKYFHTEGEAETNSSQSMVSDEEKEIAAQKSEQPCPRCGSMDIDRSGGYRGEYRCRNCRYNWQIGGKDSKA